MVAAYIACAFGIGLLSASLHWQRRLHAERLEHEKAELKRLEAQAAVLQERLRIARLHARVLSQITVGPDGLHIHF